MLVRERMTLDPITVTPEAYFLETMRIMGERGTRHLLVVDKPEHACLVFRLEGVDEEILIPALGAAGEDVVHVCCVARV